MADSKIQVRQRTFSDEWCLRGFVAEVHDGDSVKVWLDLGARFYVGSQQKPVPLRFAGVDTAELKSKTAKAKADEGRGFVSERLKPGDKVWLVTYKSADTNGLFDKYGRVLADVYYKLPLPAPAKKKKGQPTPPPPVQQWSCLNDELLQAGLAKPYAGGSKDGLWEE